MGALAATIHTLGTDIVELLLFVGTHERTRTANIRSLKPAPLPIGLHGLVAAYHSCGVSLWC